MKKLIIKLLIKVKRQARENEYQIGKLLRNLDRKQSDLCCNYTEKISVIIWKLSDDYKQLKNGETNET
tara:strand:- start:402 stop:605 length:204 start_codon:yes stop_codon:yes gene_type:complete